MPERLNGAVSKTVDPSGVRGFESHPLRHLMRQASKRVWRIEWRPEQASGASTSKGDCRGGADEAHAEETKTGWPLCSELRLGKPLVDGIQSLSGLVIE